jgi:hypothetical protein
MPEASWRTGLSRLGAAAAAAYVAVQLIQRWILMELPVAATAAERAALRVDPLNRTRLWLVFLSFFLLPVFVSAVVANVREERRPLASAGGVFFLIFILVELLYRSVELFAVVGTWVPTLLSEADPMRRLVLDAQITAFDQSVRAWYFVLMGCQLLGSLVLAAAVFERSAWNVLVAGMFGVNAARLLLRLLENYAGMTWLQPANTTIYTPAVSLFFLSVGSWLWRAGSPASRARAS